MDSWYELARLTLGLTFLISAVPKIGHITDFASAIDKYRLIPQSVTVPVAFAVVLSELTVAVLLLVGAAIMLGLGLSVLLLIVFFIAAVSNLSREDPVACYCFGAGDAPQPMKALVRVIALGFLAALCWAGVWANEESVSRPSIEALLGATAVLLLAVWIFQAPELLRQHRALRLGVKSLTSHRRVSFRSESLEPITFGRGSSQD